MRKTEKKNPAAETRDRKRSQWGDVWRRLKRNRLAMAALVVIVILVLSCVFANVIAPYSPSEMDAANRLSGCSAKHILGTDSYGRDTFTRILYGGRVSLLVSLLSVIMALVVGGLMGLTAGYFGGLYENIIMRITDILMAIPAFLMALLVSVALGGGLLNTAIAIACSAVPSYSRMARAMVLTAKGEQYVEAATSYGCSSLRIMLRQIFPNISSPLIVQSTLRIGGGIISISGLSFIGLGVQPPTAEWGSMMSSMMTYFRMQPLVVVFPGLAIILTIFSFNLFGDGLRDAMDPKLKR